MLLSVIIPIFNAAKTLQRTLGSLGRIGEHHRHKVQIILINDGSSDGSSEIIRRFVDSGMFETSELVDQSNAGSSAARNTGLERAGGVWILFLDDDDELACDPVEMIGHADSDTTAIGFSVRFRKDQKDRSSLRSPIVTRCNHLDLLTASNALTVSSLVFRRSQVKKLFDVNLHYLEDWDFWLRNPEIFGRTRLLNDKTLVVIHATSGCKTDRHKECGQCRTRIAESLSADIGDRLTRRQRNNLAIQAHIGRLQCGGALALRPFFDWPCNLVLWTKLLAYSILRNRVNRFTPYG